MKNSIAILFLVFLLSASFAQVTVQPELSFDVQPTYTRSVLMAALNTAETLKDFCTGYPSEWMDNYVSVEISTSKNGKTIKADGINEILTREQSSLLKSAELGDDITVYVVYKNKNAVTNFMDMRTMNFTMTVTPEVEAQYVGGNEKLKKYMKENVLDKLEGKEVQATRVHFTVNEKGMIVNAFITESSDDPNINELLLSVVNKMPNWKPAQNVKGVKVKQSFVLSVGNMAGC